MEVPEKGDTVSDLSVTSSTTIAAPIDEVWRAVTTPQLIKTWFFGVDTETDWTPGSPIVHTGEWQGKPYVDKGEIVRFEPPKLLVHTHWSDLSGTPDTPENYQEVSWALAQQNGATELTITEHNIHSEEGQAASEQSWSTVLDNLKGLLERENA
jgi:uncharacterized protein YndB with AHSA1/START domain